MLSDRNNNKLNICFVAHYAYRSISGSKEGHVGGIERQIGIMSKWLVSRGHSVSVITWDEGQKQDEMHGGVRVIKLCGMREGIRGLRYIHPRLTSLISAMKRADADIYYQNGSEDITGQVAIWCKLKGRKFIFSSASDVDCTKELPELRHFHERVLYRIGIRLASANITQTSAQQASFLNSFGLDSVKLPMPCEGPSDNELRERKLPSKKNILWIGRINKDKRLEYFIDIARAHPSIQFHIAGKQNDTDYPRAVFKKMKGMENIKYHGALEREQLKELYKIGFLLCCTSKYEGFPNTFLEAWSYGIPVLTTVDPDGVIEANELGHQLDDVDGFVKKIDELLKNSGVWERLSKNSRKYYVQMHKVDSVMEMFESVFQRVSHM